MAHKPCRAWGRTPVPSLLLMTTSSGESLFSLRRRWRRAEAGGNGNDIFGNGQQMQGSGLWSFRRAGGKAGCLLPLAVCALEIQNSKQAF